MPDVTCTATERAFLDALYSNFTGPVFVSLDDKQSIYKPQKVMAYNFFLTFGGQGGPEPGWVYAQPGLAARLFVNCLQEHGKAEIRT